MSEKDGVIRDAKSILIDTGSSFSCVNNINMVTNYKTSKNPICGVSNGGTMKSELEGDMLG